MLTQLDEKSIRLQQKYEDKVNKINEKRQNVKQMLKNNSINSKNERDKRFLRCKLNSGTLYHSKFLGKYSTKTLNHLRSAHSNDFTTGGLDL